MASRRAPARSSPSGFCKKSSFPRFARKEYFFQKTLRVALFTPSVLHSFFLFFGFSFFGVPVCSLRYALPTAPPRRPHPPSHRTLGPRPRHRPTPSRLVPDGVQVPTDNRRTAAAPSSSAVDEVRPSVPHRWGSHRGTNPRNKKRFSMFRETRETKSVSRCQSIKKPTATKWPSAHVENLTI